MRLEYDLTSPPEFTTSLPNGQTRRTVDRLGRWIADDTFAAQSVIPTEPELAASLGVSRATIRDAVKVLSGKGLVRTARRYGTRVTPVEEWNLLDGDVIAWHEPAHPRVRRIFVETTELRAIVEPAAAALAASRATQAQIAAILAAAYAMHPETGDVQALFDADCRFHVTILEATTNQVMQQMRQIILATLRVSYEYGVMNDANDPVTRDGHIAVAEAIARHDGPGARSAMAAMLERNQSIARGGA
jgi:DNA-binding FadR family transcriptional regulator